MGSKTGKLVIGVTGSIATGKSLVCRMLAHLGAHVIDANALFFRVMEPNAPAYKPVIEKFSELINSDGVIDSEYLNNLIFSSPQQFENVEKIVFPFVKQACDTLIAASKGKFIAVEVTNIFSSGLSEIIDLVWVVDSTAENQLRRLVEKRGFEPQQAIQYLNCSPYQKDNLLKNDVLINNDLTTEDLWVQVQKAWSSINQTQASIPAALSPVKSVANEPIATVAATNTFSLTIKRLHPQSLEQLASFINRVTGSNLSRSDVMMDFAEASYGIAEANGEIAGIIRFMVEDQTTICTKIILDPQLPSSPIIQSLMSYMTTISNDLQSEASFILLDFDTHDAIINILSNEFHYQQIEITGRLSQWLSSYKDSSLKPKIALFKQLRQTRILTPFGNTRPSISSNDIKATAIEKPSLAQMPGNLNDQVHFSVITNAQVRPGDPFLIEILAYLKEQKFEAIKLAKENLGIKNDADLNITTKGHIIVSRGTVLTVHLSLQGIEIDDPEDTILWDGEIGNTSFAVQVPEDTKLGKRLGKVNIYANGLCVVRLNFMITIGLNLAESKVELPTTEHRYRSAFASYASKDREEVVSVIQGMKKAAPHLNIFLDAWSLHSGSKWQSELVKAIESSDIFYLFWSEAASHSEWVEREWRYALNAKGIDFIDPVPLVAPMLAPPPPELAEHLHFNDWILAFKRLKSNNQPSDPSSNMKPI
ncbi:MAG: dephospho-CoA kinase [Anaerolineae bacterium]|nr:dephospho-CoA kinase [Anaerolineae bacterium]